MIVLTERLRGQVMWAMNRVTKINLKERNPAGEAQYSATVNNLPCAHCEYFEFRNC